jgi:hypothetical protein
MADFAHPGQFEQNLAAVNAELDEMIRYWQIIRPGQSFMAAVLQMHQSVHDSQPTEADLYRLLVIAVARLAAKR